MPWYLVACFTKQAKTASYGNVIAQARRFSVGFYPPLLPSWRLWQTVPINSFNVDAGGYAFSRYAKTTRGGGTSVRRRRGYGVACLATVASPRFMPLPSPSTLYAHHSVQRYYITEGLLFPAPTTAQIARTTLSYPVHNSTSLHWTLPSSADVTKNYKPIAVRVINSRAYQRYLPIPCVDVKRHARNDTVFKHSTPLHRATPAGNNSSSRLLLLPLL